MNILDRLRLNTGAVLCLCITMAAAQEPPAAADVENTPADEAAEPAVEAAAPAAETAAPEPAPAGDGAFSVEAPSAAETPVPRTGAKRIVMLPVEFIIYQKSVAGIEAVPEWTETAQFALGDAAIRKLRDDQRFEIVNVPHFEGETKDVLQEHVEFFKVIGNTALTMIQDGGKVWAEKGANFDYTLGDGLSFLADAADADYAFIICGSQVTQTGGSVFLQFLSAAAIGMYAPGGGTYVLAGIVDLRSGRIAWLNSRMGSQVFGMTGSDVRKPETAAEVISKMFEGFPENKLISFPPF
jgi:hypothetical protein